MIFKYIFTGGPMHEFVYRWGPASSPQRGPIGTRLLWGEKLREVIANVSNHLENL